MPGDSPWKAAAAVITANLAMLMLGGSSSELVAEILAASSAAKLCSSALRARRLSRVVGEGQHLGLALLVGA